jgi:hypothetical protein
LKRSSLPSSLIAGYNLARLELSVILVANDQNKVIEIEK